MVRWEPNRNSEYSRALAEATRLAPRTEPEASAYWLAWRKSRPKTCCWPECITRWAGANSDAEHEWFGDVPLCTTHLYEAWRIACDSAESYDKYQRRCELIALADDGGDRRSIRGGYKVPPRRQRPEAARRGTIYYLKVDGFIKIGYATHLTTRMKAYPPSAQLLVAYPGTMADETVLHDLMAEHRAARREWYHPDPRLLDHIHCMINRHGAPPSSDATITLTTSSA